MQRKPMSGRCVSQAATFQLVVVKRITAVILLLFFGLLAALFGQPADANALPLGKSCQTIQRALDKLPADGGEVIIPAGTYLCTKPIVLDKSRVKLRGAGPATLLKLADNANAPVIVMGSTENVPSKTVKYLVVSDLMIDGNRAHLVILLPTKVRG